MSNIAEAKIFVIGNEKGGAGKTTCAMHLTCALLDRGLKVATLDADVRQGSFTNYISNRKRYVEENQNTSISLPIHFELKEFEGDSYSDKEKIESQRFEELLQEAASVADVVVIDTPGSFTGYSRIAHSHADVIITPINDSFIDLDLIAQIDPNTLDVVRPSIYSEAVWKYKMLKSKRSGKSIDWILVRNRLSCLESGNKKNMGIALEKICKRLGLRVASGFTERVIFREMFLQGLTLLDLPHVKHTKMINSSHIAARQELRSFLSSLGFGD